MSLSPIANAVVFENMQEAVIVVDGKNQIVKINPAAEKLLTQTKDSLIGKSIQELFHDQPKLLAKFGHVTQITTEIIVNGRYFELRISPIQENNNLLGKVIVLHEITTHKNTERILQQQSERLALLHQISTDTQKSVAAKLQEALALATQTLNMKIGIISRIANDTYTVKHLYAVEGEIQKGQVFPLGATFCSITLSTDDVVSLNYVQYSSYAQHPCYINTQLEAYIGKTIRVNGQIYGTLNFSSHQPRVNPFQKEDEEFVNLLAHWIQSEIEHHQATKNILENHTRIEALYQVTQALIRYADLPDFLQTVTDGVAVALPANRVSLIVFDEYKQQIEHIIRGGIGADFIQDINYEELSAGLTGWVLKNGEAVLSPKNVPDPRESAIVQKRRLETNSGSIIVVPVQYQTTTIGTLTAINLPQERDFDQKDLALLEALAGQTAIALENKRLLDAERARTQELEETNRRLDTFSHMVAHDLKSPLSLIIGYTEFILMDQPLAAPDIRLQRIIDSARKMGNIIDELLLLASIQQKKIKTSPVAMTFIIEEALNRLALIVEESEAKIIRPSTWPIARGYAPWIEEVWVNYISNAIKYGGTPPLIELGATELAQEQICFWVKDNGQTITPDDESKLFQKFERLEPTKATGHGLGLSIVKQIVEMLEGTVGFKRLSTQGSMFYFTLPAATFEES